MDLQPYLRASWQDLQRELIRKGRRPQLVLSAHALFDAHLARALELAFTDAEQSIGDTRYTQLASRYRDAYARAFGAIRLRYDADEDGTAEEGDSLPAISSVLFGNLPPQSWRGGW